MELLRTNSDEALQQALMEHKYSIDSMYEILQENRSLLPGLRNEIAKIESSPLDISLYILNGFKSALDKHAEAKALTACDSSAAIVRTHTARAKMYANLALELAHRNRKVVDTTKDDWRTRPKLVPSADYKKALVESILAGETEYDASEVDQFIYQASNSLDIDIENRWSSEYRRQPSRLRSRRIRRVSIAATAATIGIGSVFAPSAAAAENLTIPTDDPQTREYSLPSERDGVLSENDATSLQYEGSAAMPGSSPETSAVLATSEPVEIIDEEITLADPESISAAEATPQQISAEDGGQEGAAVTQERAVEASDEAPVGDEVNHEAESPSESAGTDIVPVEAADSEAVVESEVVDEPLLSDNEVEESFALSLPTPTVAPVAPEYRDTSSAEESEDESRAQEEQSTSSPAPERASGESDRAEQIEQVDTPDPTEATPLADPETIAPSDPAESALELPAIELPVDESEEGDDETSAEEALGQGAAGFQLAAPAAIGATEMQSLALPDVEVEDEDTGVAILDFPSLPEPKVTHIPAEPIERPEPKVDQVKPKIEREGRGGWFWPVPAHINAAPDYAGHLGTDYDTGPGDPVTAVRDGVVVGVGIDPTMNKEMCSKLTDALVGPYGDGVGLTMLDDQYYVEIEHADGAGGVKRSKYVHVTKEGIKVKVGDKVWGGQPIAVAGNTGCSTGDHLHLSLFDANGQVVSAKQQHILGIYGY